MSHGRTRQSNSFNLKTPLCRSSTFQASYFNRITKLWNFISSLKSPSNFPSLQSFKQFVYKTMFTTLVNIYEVERSNISNDLSLSQVEVTVSTTSTFLYFWLSSTSIMASNNAHACFRKCSQRGTRRQKFYSHMCETTQLKLSFQHFTKKIYLLLQHLSLLHSTLCPLPDLTQLFEMKFRWYLLLLV